ncbi:MAG TPA: hypothetical protein VGE59_02080 [Patescibacteria group bacterium]
MDNTSNDPVQDLIDEGMERFGEGGPDGNIDDAIRRGEDQVEQDADPADGELESFRSDLGQEEPGTLEPGHKKDPTESDWL